LPMVMGRGRRRAQALALAGEALERVGVGHVALKRWVELSSWERVLVGLAGAVVARPRLLVVDDLLDGLGASRTQQVGDLLHSLVQEFGFGVLFGVSDIEAAVMAHRVLAFEGRSLRVLSDHTPARQADELALARVARAHRSVRPASHVC
jgi:ABC-type taurine transport system ATPase subunit